MRILFFMNHADKGGAALAYKELIEHLYSTYKIECVVYTAKKNNLNKIFDEQGIFNSYASYRNFISSYHSPRIIWRLLFCVRHFLGNKLAIKKIEREVDFSSIDLIYSNLDRIDIGAILSKKYNLPHVWHIREHLDTDFKIISVYKDYVKYMKSYNSKFIAISQSVKNAWVSRGFSENDIDVIYDGVNIENIYSKGNWFKNNKINILFIGGYSKEKGQADFLSAISKVPERYLDKIDISFYGSGCDRYIDKLNSLISNSKVSEICHFNKYTSDIYHKIKDYDIGVNYSVEEGFGRVTIEYMAAGICVICSASGANKELVGSNDGIFVDRNNEKDICNVLMYLIKNRKEIITYGNNARRRASKFTTAKHTENMYNIFIQILKGENVNA